MRVLLFALAVAFAATARPAVGQTTSSDVQSLIQAYLNGQVTRDMKPTVDAYIVAHPDDGEAYALRCAIEEAIAKHDGTGLHEAAQDCKKGLTLAPKSAFANLVTADLLYDSDDIPESIPFYSTAIKQGMTSGGVFWKRCDAYRRSGDLPDALGDCQKQLQLTPSGFDALYAYGHLQYVRGAYSDALANLTAAIGTQPKNIDALYWRGMTYAAVGKFELAEADFTECISLGDESADTYFARGQARRQLGNTAGGTSDLEESLRRYKASGMTKQAAQVDAMLKTTTPQPFQPPL